MNNILIVEDNHDNMSLIAEILEDEGFNTTGVYNAETAINWLESNKADLILMDISLPKMSGLEAAEIIKQTHETADIPIIAITAHAMNTDRIKSLAAGCDEHMTKPIDDELVIKTINRLLS